MCFLFCMNILQPSKKEESNVVHIFKIQNQDVSIEYL